jgi:asparagine synthase (glutamine-hydrolysing)
VRDRGLLQQHDGKKLVDIMNDRIPHRGPDSTGTWSHEEDRVTAQLGFRRLSLINLRPTGDQPLHKDGLTVVYNGELYNYRALRAGLVIRGARFRTQSHTGVVLEAWRRWGPDALPQFRGMFTFALFGERTGELVLARDPFGIKLLYYLLRGSGVAFASELKALVAAIGSELRIEPGAPVASMLYYWLPEQLCALDGVRKLPGGSWALLRSDGSLTVRPYWRIADVAAQAAAGPPASTSPGCWPTGTAACPSASGTGSCSPRSTGCPSARRAGACVTPGGRSASSSSPSCGKSRGSAAATRCTTRPSWPTW